MKKLIIHLGPGKCGSSSIQSFFMSHKRPCVEKLNFTQLEPVIIDELNQEIVDVETITNFSKFLKKNLRSCKTLILSHEYLFSCPDSIKNICNISEGLVSDITIIGYSRRQSGFVVSLYSQWLFRSPERASEAKAVLEDIGLDPLYFSGLERQLIASISNDFYSARQLSGTSILDWNNSYGGLEKIISPSEATIKCGVLPKKHSSRNLIEDFCDKAGLTMRDRIKNTSNIAENTKFNNDLIESLYNAMELGFEVPGPHDDNEYLSEISKNMNSLKKSDDPFIIKLKEYIDSYYFRSNIEFCERYGLDKDYFETSIVHSKNEILKIIKEEQQKRTSDNSVADHYKKLSAIMAETCLLLVKNSGNNPKN